MSTTRYAGFWIRVVASIIDSLLLLAVATPILLAFFDAEQLQTGELNSHPVYLLINYVFPAVAVIVFWVYKSATPGKMVFGIRIIDEKTGGQPSNAQLVGRYFAYYVSLIPLFLGFIWVGLDKRKQGWHDKLAGTLVVRDTSPADAIEAVETDDNRPPEN